MSPDIATLMMLGQMVQDDRKAEAKVAEHLAVFGPTVSRLTATALHAMLEAVAAEHVKRYGEDDRAAVYLSRQAQRDEVRK